MKLQRLLHFKCIINKSYARYLTIKTDRAPLKNRFLILKSLGLFLFRNKLYPALPDEGRKLVRYNLKVHTKTK